MGYLHLPLNAVKIITYIEIWIQFSCQTTAFTHGTAHFSCTLLFLDPNYFLARLSQSYLNNSDFFPTSFYLSISLFKQLFFHSPCTLHISNSFPEVAAHTATSEALLPSLIASQSRLTRRNSRFQLIPPTSSLLPAMLANTLPSRY